MNARIEFDREIKGLRSQVAAKRGDLSAAKTQAANAQRLVGTIEREIQSLENRIAELSAPIQDETILVTEHAVIRYLERVYNIDIDSVRSEIIAGAESQIKFMRNGEVKRSQGHTLVVKNSTVVTIK